MPEPFRFTVPGKPEPWLRAGSQGTKRFTRKAVADFKRRVQAYAYQAGVRDHFIPRGTPVHIVVACYYDCKSPLKRKMRPKVWKCTLPDADNLQKCVFDALNGIAFFDDGQACHVECFKFHAEQGEPARTEVLIEPAGPVPKACPVWGVEIPYQPREGA